ncbi:OsmC family protein [Silvimonas amylolytica]|uniref:Osmotically inducible protein OsmC n=1 Tax=Silvimonas amylolytica TaxID=449663 RepID=A0ABQ2PN59_9NEIS|nr:OsmC family protein [Silvimonas amylolytica]GGP26746.1 osmotically inducible protein OsmC [Silvimonas amylolytica]
MQKSGSAQWQGAIKDGIGSVSTQSGVLKDAPYGFKARFEGGPGTNPEELIGAAHAGCFSMALSLQLTEAGTIAERINTKATVTLEKDDTGFTITAVHLDVVARIPDATPESFAKAANAAKAGCPVSKLLNANITMDARLES